MICRYELHGWNRLNGVCKYKRDMHVWDGYILLRDVNQLAWCFNCKIFARLWMRHTHGNEVCTCEPVNRVRSYLRNALLWMECTCVNGTGETYKCVCICKTRAHLWMEMRICEGELAVENRATYLLTGHLRCEWDLIPLNGTTHVWTGPLMFGRNPFNHLLWPRFRAMKWYRFVSVPKRPIPLSISSARSGRLCFLNHCLVYVSCLYFLSLSHNYEWTGLSFAVLRLINFWRLC